jgi:hypothetical protein
MIDTPNTVSETAATAESDAPASPPNVPMESPPAIGDPEVIENPSKSEPGPVAPAPLKI